jgi:chemotaxis signal transduction protein
METNELAQYLCVTVSGKILGLDATRILEVVKPDSIPASELIKQDETADFTYRGKKLQAVYLSEIIFSEKFQYDSAWRILISRIEEIPVGLFVNSVEEIVRVKPEEIRPLKTTETDLKAELLQGTLEIDDRNIHIVSLDNIHRLIIAR